MIRLGRSRLMAVGVLLGAGILQVLAVQPAFAAHATVGLYGYASMQFSGQCSTGGSGTLSRSTAEVSRTGSTISVSIQLIGANPNDTYEASLQQAAGCATYVHSISTDSNGNGSVRFTAQAAGPVGKDPLIVDVDRTSPCPSANPCIEPENPAYRSAVLSG